MTQEKWLEVKNRLLETFEGCLQGTREEGVENIEWVEFSNHAGVKMRLEWHDSPKKLGEKTLHSNRIGADVTIEMEYSDTERVQRVELLIWSESKQDWIEGDVSAVL